MTDLLPIEDYMAKRKETVRLYVETTKNLEDCKNSLPAARNSNQTVWWSSDKKNESIELNNVNEIVTEIP